MERFIVDLINSFLQRAVFRMNIFDSISLSLGHGDASGVYLISVRNGDWINRYPEKKILVISLTPLPR
jgi:hypothetical protein